MKVAALFSLPLAAGLVAPSAAPARTELNAVAGMIGGVQAGDPMPGEGAWDPLGFSNIFDMIQGSEHAGVFPSLTEGYTFPEGAWGGSMERAPGDLGYRVMRK